MQLFSLEMIKKRVVVKHEMPKFKLDELIEKGLSKEQIQQQIQRELYQEFMKGISSNIPTSVTPNPNGDEIYTIEGYVLSHLTLMELVKEIIDLDDIMREKLLNSLNYAITYRPNNMK